MRLTRLGLDRDLDTVVVLGAGATAGARVSTTPPLGRAFVDTDFFDQLTYFSANAASDSFRADASDFLGFLRSRYGNVPHGLEEIFAELDVTNQFNEATRARKQGRPPREFDRRAEQLKRLIVLALRESLGASEANLPVCDLHLAVLRTLGVKDAVVSFNYDLLADRAMSSGLASKFKPGVSYGFEPSAVSGEWAPPPKLGSPFRNHTKLYKPHGSLHWRDTGEAVEIAASEVSINADDVAIVPPQLIKRFDAEPYESIWRGARKAIAGARAIILAGYSLPSSDIATTAALRLEAEELQLVCIANPDDAVVRRTLDVLRTAITDKTIVVRLRTFSELALRFGVQSDRALAEEQQDFSWMENVIDQRVYDLVPEAYDRAVNRLFE